ncbi:MAG: Dabb family protein [Cyanobium sp.]
MLHHVVLFRFRSDLPEGAVDAVFAELRSLPQAIGGIRSFQGGAYHSWEGLSQGFTHGFTMVFEDGPARDAYLPHPAHQAVVERLVPMLEGGLAGVVAFDFMDGVMR